MKRQSIDSTILFFAGVVLSVVFASVALIKNDNAPSSASAFHVDPTTGGLITAGLVFVASIMRPLIDKILDKTKQSTDKDLRDRELKIKEAESALKSEEKRYQLENELFNEVTAGSKVVMMFIKKHYRDESIAEKENSNSEEFYQDLLEINAMLRKVNIAKARALPNNKDFLRPQNDVSDDPIQAEVRYAFLMQIYFNTILEMLSGADAPPIFERIKGVDGQSPLPEKYNVK